MTTGCVLPRNDQGISAGERGGLNRQTIHYMQCLRDRPAAWTPNPLSKNPLALRPCSKCGQRASWVSRILGWKRTTQIHGRPPWCITLAFSLIFRYSSPLGLTNMQVVERRVPPLRWRVVQFSANGVQIPRSRIKSPLKEAAEQLLA